MYLLCAHYYPVRTLPIKWKTLVGGLVVELSRETVADLTAVLGAEKPETCGGNGGTSESETSPENSSRAEVPQKRAYK